MGYTACTVWCHLWWILLDFFVWSKKRHWNWAPVFQACTWKIHYEQALQLCRKPLEARGFCMITAVELQESQEENSPREIIWLWVSLEKSMPTSQLRKESYYLNRSRITAFTVGRGKEQRKKEQLCFALPWLLLRVWECQRKCVCSVHTLLTGRDWGWEPRPTPLRSPQHGAGNAQAVVTDSIDGASEKRQRQVFDWTAGTHVLLVLLSTADVFLLYSYGATSTDMLSCISSWKLLSSGALRGWAAVLLCTQGGDFSGSQEMPHRARVSQRAASWNALRKPH